MAGIRCLESDHTVSWQRFEVFIPLDFFQLRLLLISEYCRLILNSRHLVFVSACQTGKYLLLMRH